MAVVWTILIVIGVLLFLAFHAFTGGFENDTSSGGGMYS